jgi:uncharacterized protein with FMN-binding domain
MKKFALSVTVIVAFFLYSLFTHLQNQPDVALSPVPAGQSLRPEAPAGSPLGGASPTPTPAGQSPLGGATSPPAPQGKYKDGSYTGDPADAYYGTIQVKATVTNGKLTDVTFLQYPNDRQTSIEINTQAMPMLKSEAITAQSGSVDIISGATDSSQAFIQSLTSALNQAK